MNGIGLPSYSSLPFADQSLPRPSLLKWRWFRLRMPPRLLLVVLLAAQIIVLAIVRLGPGVVPRVASARQSMPLFVGTASQIHLKFLPLENKDSPSLPTQETRPSLPQEGRNASLLASESADELPASASTQDDSSPSNEDESRSETHIRGGDESPADDENRRFDTPVLTVSGDASPTREGKSLEETVVLRTVDDLLPSVDGTTVLTASGDAFTTTEGKPLEETEGKSLEEKVRLKTGDDLLPSVDETIVLTGGTEGKSVEERVSLKTGDLLPSVDETIVLTGSGDASPTTEGKSLEETEGKSVEERVGLKTGDELLPSVEDTSVPQELATKKEESPTSDEKLIGDTSPSTSEKSPDEIVAPKTADDLLPSVEDSFLSEAHAASTPSAKKERSAILKEATAEKSTFHEAAPSVEDEKPPIVGEATAEKPTFHEASPSVEEKSNSETLKSADPQAEKSQNEPIVSADGSKEQSFIAEKVTPTVSSQCPFGYIYVYDLPAAFNHDIVANCSALNPWTNVCPTLANGGLGESLGDASPLGQTGSWFISDQFTAEMVFHNRILQHPCLTDKPELASGFYVPFYAGLDVGRYLWRGSSAELRDRVSKQLLEWLDGQEYWRRSGGWNHFMMIGRITWDFRRSRDEDWGSGFFYNPPMRNTTRLLIERNPWDGQEMAVPYPTNFHPQSDADLRAWQDHLRSLNRSYLFSFAGAPRKNFPNDFRAILVSQCEQAQSCMSLDCSTQTCGNNQKSLELFMNSIFCLQPRGDSFTRRSTFDCLLAGSIPVFFWHRSAYWQYKWHLPSDDESSYSVFIPKEDMRNGTKIEQVLTSLSSEKVQAMQEAVIKMIPRIVYAVSGFSLKEETDAFDVAIEGVLRRFKQLSLS